MDFRNAKELLELCRQEGCSISQIMRRRECELGETTPDTVDRRMARVLEIMRQSATTPLKTPVRSMGGLIGGESKLLFAHAAKKKDICGPVLEKAITYAMAVLEVNASMGLIVAAPTAGSAGVLPGLLLALQDCYHISARPRWAWPPPWPLRRRWSSWGAPRSSVWTPPPLCS